MAKPHRRREPIRRPIPAPRRGPAPVPMVPRFDTTPLIDVLPRVPIDVLPLYSVLAIVHQAMSGKPAGACVPGCHQIATALSLLGFDAEPMAAHVAIYDQAGQRTLSQIGVPEPPTVRPDGTTNGHMIVWSDSFGRLIDPTVIQDPLLMRLARQNVALTAPVLLPIPGGRTAALGSPLVTPRGPYLVAWTLQPQWTPLLNGVLDGTMGTGVQLGALAVAHDTLAVLCAAAQFRDTSGLAALSPTLRDLLSGERHLPDLPAELPADVAALIADPVGWFRRWP